MASGCSGPRAIPVVDLCQPRAEVVAAISAASRSVGFFQVVGHSVPLEAVAAGRSAAQAFFSQPLAQKEQHKLVWAGSVNHGYARLGREAADVANNSLTKEAIPDLMESFQLADPDIKPAAEQGLDPESAMVALYRRLRQCAGELLDLMEEGLKEAQAPAGFRAGHFADDTHYTVLRVTKYPKLSDCGLAPQPGVSRISPHRDLGSITLLVQDSAGGLEAQDQETGEWFAVPPRADAIVVNCGNLMARWTNNVYRSSIHRVLTTADSADKDRYSCILFMQPNHGLVVDPPPGCITDANPRRWEPTEVRAYMNCKFTQLFDPEARKHKGACRFDD